MSNITGDDSFSSGEVQQRHHPQNPSLGSAPASAKKKRNLPGTPDPSAEVIALSPTSLMATNTFVCEICQRGFQRGQNLQLHRRGHNLPWKLKQTTTTEVIRKRVYVCPEPSCVHHSPDRALGDLTGIKKHYRRKHGEKKWECEKCDKKYAVTSDWKAHQKTCGTREYACDCGTIFSRRDSFITHRAFCEALSKETSKENQVTMGPMGPSPILEAQLAYGLPITGAATATGMSEFKPMNMTSMFCSSIPSSSLAGLSISPGNKLGQIYGPPDMSATALLQKAAQIGPTSSNSMDSSMMQTTFQSPNDQASPFDGGFVQKTTQEVAAHLFEGGGPSGSSMSGMIMNGGMLIGKKKPAVEFLRTLVEGVQEDRYRNLRFVYGRGSRTMPRTQTRLGGNAIPTLDFLGLRGSRPQDILDQGLDMENMDQERMQVMDHPAANSYSDV